MDAPTSLTRRRALPSGTVSFLFSDIEGSTRLVERLGTAAWTPVLAAHQAIIRDAIGTRDGHEIATEGDSFFVVFATADAAVAAAVAIQRGLADHSWPPGVTVRVRIGVHTGEAVLVGDDYVGLDVHRAARIAAAGHGGQTLLSATTAALVGDRPETGVSIRSRGEHRLKDLSRPERLAEAIIDGLPTEFPPLRTLEITPNNLPTQLTSFLGRGREIAEIGELLRTARLLTLTGPGGTGKTRLSLEVAGQAAERFADGVFFVPLAAIDDPDLVAPTMASEIGLPDRGGESPVEALVDHLRSRRVLLVLDNFEQVVDAAPTVARLLADAPGLAVLATSRILLKVYGEREYPVPPLGVPAAEGAADAASLAAFDAVRLFMERAVAVRPDFRLTDDNAAAVAGICRRLDGLPLAIELAAARVRLLPPAAILRRLQKVLDLPGQGGAVDLPARQQTLRGAIAWSHDLLDPPDRMLFACLSVFVGGAGIDAIEEVCGSEAGGDVFDRVASLVEQSLLRVGEDFEGEPRFTMLETIREFAIERLDDVGRTAELRARHADRYCSLVERARGAIMGSDKRRWLDRLQLEHGNIRAAFGWSIEVGDVARVLRLSAGLWRFWQMRGYLAEGEERVAQALAMASSHDLPELRAQALEAAGGLAYWRGRHMAARTSYEEALAIRRRLGDVAAEAEQVYNLSFTYAYGDHVDAERSLELTAEALALFREAGDRVGVAKALWALSNGEYAHGEPEAGRNHALEALTIFESVDDRFMVAWSEYIVAVNQIVLELPLDDTARRLERALRLFVEAGDVSGYVLILDVLSYVAQAEGDLPRAARIAGGVAALEAASGTGLNIVNRRIVGYDPEALRAQPAWTEGNRMSVADLIAYALRAPA